MRPVLAIRSISASPDANRSTLRGGLARLSALGSICMRCVILAASLAVVGSWSVPAMAGSDAVKSGESFPCTAVAVWDGEGRSGAPRGHGSGWPGWPRANSMAVAGRVIRAGAERDHGTQHAGRAARRRARHADGRGISRSARCALRCMSEGDGKGGRTAAWCVAPRVGDLSCALVEQGGRACAGTVTGATGSAGPRPERRSGQGAVQAVAAGQREDRRRRRSAAGRD